MAVDWTKKNISAFGVLVTALALTSFQGWFWSPFGVGQYWSAASGGDAKVNQLGWLLFPVVVLLSWVSAWVLAHFAWLSAVSNAFEAFMNSFWMSFFVTLPMLGGGLWTTQPLFAIAISVVNVFATSILAGQVYFAVAGDLGSPHK